MWVNTRYVTPPEIHTDNLVFIIHKIGHIWAACGWQNVQIWGLTTQVLNTSSVEFENVTWVEYLSPTVYLHTRWQLSLAILVPAVGSLVIHASTEGATEGGKSSTDFGDRLRFPLLFWLETDTCHFLLPVHYPKDSMILQGWNQVLT